MSDEMRYRNNIEKLRIERGMKVMDLAEAAGISRMYLTDLKKGKKRLNSDILERIAKVLNVSPSEIISEAPAAVPLVGYVGAGSEIYPIDDHPKGDGLEEIDLPFPVDPSAVAVRVKGDSMHPAYFEGDVLVFKRDMPYDENCLNMRCIVKTSDDKCYVKVLRKGTKPNTFHLESFNAPLIVDVELEWCAKIILTLNA